MGRHPCRRKITGNESHCLEAMGQGMIPWTEREGAYRHMAYLDRLIAMESVAGRHPSKRANWLKFCSRCGSDISSSPRCVRECSSCNSQEAARRAGGRIARRQS